MTPLVPIAMFGFIPAALVMFALLPARRAVLATYIAGWLFLPIAGYDVPGLTAFNKVTAIPIAALLGVLLFDPMRLQQFRPRLVDIPMAVWCFSTVLTSMVNGLGVYDGLSSAATHVFLWGAPYFLGRIYFSDLAGLRELALGVLIGGIVYAPLCLYEIRMSPILHSDLYGFHQHVFAQSRRFGGWRPTVFMQHGLAVGMWMAMATLVGAWLWRTGAVRSILHVPMSLIVPAMGLVTVLCKSVAALGLLLVGGALLQLSAAARTRVLVIALIAAAPAYMTVRSLGLWSGGELVAAARVIDDSRAASLQTRLNAENLLISRAWGRPVLGWGSWGRNRVFTEEGFDTAVTDGLWIIAFGQRGVVGLGALTAAMLLPALLLVRRFPARHWTHPALAPAVALAMLLTLFMIDCLFNAMTNPIFTLAAGGLASFATTLGAPPGVARRPVRIPAASGPAGRPSRARGGPGAMEGATR